MFESRQHYYNTTQTHRNTINGIMNTLFVACCIRPTVPIPGGWWFSSWRAAENLFSFTVWKGFSPLNTKKEHDTPDTIPSENHTLH